MGDILKNREHEKSSQRDPSTKESLYPNSSGLKRVNHGHNSSRFSGNPQQQPSSGHFNQLNLLGSRRVSRIKQS